MTTQQDQKIEELSDRVRTLVDRVYVLERENRTIKEKYRDALERLDEAEADMIRLVERNAPLVGAAGSMSDEQLVALGESLRKRDPYMVPLTVLGEDDRHG